MATSATRTPRRCLRSRDRASPGGTFTRGWRGQSPTMSSSTSSRGGTSRASSTGRSTRSIRLRKKIKQKFLLWSYPTWGVLVKFLIFLSGYFLPALTSTLQRRRPATTPSARGTCSSSGPSPTTQSCLSPTAPGCSTARRAGSWSLPSPPPTYSTSGTRRTLSTWRTRYVAFFPKKKTCRGNLQVIELAFLQYFLGSAYSWLQDNDTNCNHTIPCEITQKVIDKIHLNQRFCAYICIPMFPEGNPASAPIQEILYWQTRLGTGIDWATCVCVFFFLFFSFPQLSTFFCYFTHRTIEMMYRRVGDAISRAGLNSHPTDWLVFLCPGKREPDGPWLEQLEPATEPMAATMRQTRRGPIYVHSKMLIVDDAYILVGSANINQVGCYYSK